MVVYMNLRQCPNLVVAVAVFAVTVVVVVWKLFSLNAQS